VFRVRKVLILYFENDGAVMAEGGLEGLWVENLRRSVINIFSGGDDRGSSVQERNLEYEGLVGRNSEGDPHAS